MATNPRIPYEERKQPQLVPNNDPLKPKRPGGGIPGHMIGIVVALILLGVLIYLLPRTPKNAPPPTNAQVPAQPVPSQLHFHGMQVIDGPTDNSFYLVGHITNTGPQTVNGIVAEVKLRGPLEQVLLDVKRPVEGMSGEENQLISDPFAKDPLKSNDTRPFRVAINGAPNFWNHNVPDMQIVHVTGEGR
jgi:hypothetical protein